MGIPTEEYPLVLHGDIRAWEEVSGGFVFVLIEDVDDREKLLLPEDTLVPLQRYLTEVIGRHRLDSEIVDAVVDYRSLSTELWEILRPLVYVPNRGTNNQKLIAAVSALANSYRNLIEDECGPFDPEEES